MAEPRAHAAAVAAGEHDQFGICFEHVFLRQLHHLHTRLPSPVSFRSSPDSHSLACSPNTLVSKRGLTAVVDLVPVGGKRGVTFGVWSCRCCRSPPPSLQPVFEHLTSRAKLFWPTEQDQLHPPVATVKDYRIGAPVQLPPSDHPPS